MIFVETKSGIYRATSKTQQLNTTKRPIEKTLNTNGIKGLDAINTLTCIARAPMGELVCGTYPTRSLLLLRSVQRYALQER